MDTRLVNSQLISKKDVRVWFFEGGREYAGPATMVADNGIMFQAKLEAPRGIDPLTWTTELRSKLKGRTVQAELTSPKTKLEVRLVLESVTVSSAKSQVVAFTATWVSPPDPRALRLLLEPSVTRVPKKT
jgi:hypothetical protein